MHLVGENFEKPQNYFFKDILINAMRAIFHVPLSIILAPMGYGKKIAVSSYLLSTDADIMWLTLPENSDESYLWRKLNNLLTEMETSESWDSIGTFEKIDSIIAAINEKAKHNTGKEYVLVIYKLQYVSDPNGNIRCFLKRFIDIFVPNFHIVLISTASVHFESSFFMNNYINIVGTRLLRLDKRGISLFFKSYGIELNKSELDTAERISEGWLNAISAMAFIVLERGQFNARTLIEVKQRMAEYIRNSLYNNLPSDVKSFVVSMYPAGDFSREQAKFICDNSHFGVDSNKCIDYLLDNNILIDYYYENELFHIHNLLNVVAGEEYFSLPKHCCDSLENTVAAWCAEYKCMNYLCYPKIEGELSIEVLGDINILTTREKEVFNCIRQGLAYKETALELCISENTVKTMLKKIYRKMGINSRKELVNETDSIEYSRQLKAQKRYQTLPLAEKTL